MRNLSIASALLLAGTAVYQRGTQTSPSTSLPSTPMSASDGEKASTGPYSILCKALPATAGHLATTDLPVESKESCGELLDEYKNLEVMIAFVPDPYQTRMRLEFDRSIEAISWAAADAAKGALRDFWLPWSNTAQTPLESLGDRRAADAELAEKRKKPGVLVFSRPGNKALAILVVGESPTKGFDKDELRAALSYWEDLVQLSEDPHKQIWQIPIVGPQFSGTFRPLKVMVKEFSASDARHGEIELRFLSGTATSLPLAQEFQQDLPNVHYRGVAVPDVYRLKALQNHLGKSKIAMLSEDETAFGMDQERVKAPQLADDTPRSFHFPRGTVYLRNAYQDDPTLLAAPTLDVNPGRRSLQLNLRDNSVPRDSIPSFGDQTPVAQEREMDLLAESVHHEHYDLGIVSATDILDSLFVSRYLRLAAPNTRLAFFDADLLAARPDYPPLTGSLIVTNYPLFAARLEWIPQLAQKPADTRLFSSQFEEGLYNATSAFIQENETQIKGTYGVPRLLDQVASCGPLANSTSRGGRPSPEATCGPGKPPLWLATIGHEGIWPVALLDWPEKETPPNAPFPEVIGPLWEFKGGHALRSWWLLYFLGLGCIVALLVIVGSGLFKQEQSVIQLGQNASAPRLLYVLWLLVSVGGAWVTINTGSLGYVIHGSDWKIGIAVVGAAVAGFGLLICAVHISKRIQRLRSLPWIHVWIPWTILIVFCVSSVWLLQDGYTFHGFFYAFRSIELNNGVSPLPPVLFLFFALISWSTIHLQRQIFAEERYRYVPDLAHTRLRALAEDLKECLESTFPRPSRASAGIALTIGVLISVGCYFHVKSLEGSVFDATYSFLVAFITAFLFLAIFRFSRTWALLRTLLEQLELHPIREGFSALPAEYSWSPVWQHSAHKRSHVHLARSLECLHELRARREWLAEQDRDDVETLGDAVLLHTASTEDERATQYRQLQDALTGVADSFAADLNDGPWKKGTSDTLRKANREEPLNDRALLRREFIALRLVAYIRYVMLHLRNLLTFIIVGYIMLVLSLGSYPFDSPQLIAWGLVLTFILMGVFVAWVFLEMDKDPALRRIMDKTAGETEWGGLRRIGAFGILPLLSLIATHFPSAGHYLTSWLQPVLKAMH